MDHQTVMAYLNRVGVTAPTAGDTAGLRTLHRAHQLTVPFENLSIHLAEPISLDEHDLIDKIVHRRRGGLAVEGRLQPGGRLVRSAALCLVDPEAHWGVPS